MKIIVILALLLCTGLADRRIIARPIQSTYNQYGGIEQIIVQWKCFNTIFANDFIKITVTEPLHGNTSLAISFSLSTANSNSAIVRKNSLPYASNNTYFLPVSTNLSGSIWYELRLDVKTDLAKIYGLVQLEVVGGETPLANVYEWNDGFEYFHLEETTIPSLTIFTININSTLSTIAGNRYSVLL
jgi:hypothetical protein